MRVWIATALLMISVPALASDVQLYENGTPTSTMEFGAAVGAGNVYQPSNSASANVGFSGNIGIGCSGISPQAFIQSINPTQIINRFKNTIISGTESGLENYLLATAYSNPTLASVMNIENKTLNANFNMFASQCSLQQAKAEGAQMGARKMAQAHNECFEQQIASGVGPSQAYNNCVDSSSALSDIVDNKMPESFGNLGFLKNYTDMNVTSKVESLLGLMQDTKVGKNSSGSASLLVRAPRTTVYKMNANMASHVQYAIQQILGGTPPSDIANCTAKDLNQPASGYTGACLPTQARNIVDSSGFKAAEQLPPSAQNLYASALSGQIAIADIRAQIIALYNQIDELELQQKKAAEKTTTAAFLEKKTDLLKQISALENQVNAMQNYENAKTKIAQTEVAAVELNQSQIQSEATMAPHAPYNANAAASPNPLGVL
jgi:hypothetical protein